MQSKITNLHNDNITDDDTYYNITDDDIKNHHIIDNDIKNSDIIDDNIINTFIQDSCTINKNYLENIEIDFIKKEIINAENKLIKEIFELLVKPVEQHILNCSKKSIVWAKLNYIISNDLILLTDNYIITKTLIINNIFFVQKLNNILCNVQCEKYKENFLFPVYVEINKIKYNIYEFVFMPLP
jgi:hypothetical protein